MSKQNVIAALVAIFIYTFILPDPARSQSALDKQIDSLFVIASSGEVKYRDLVDPAIEQIAALGPDAVPHLIGKLDTKSARERLTIINIFRKIGSPAVPDLLAALKLKDGLVVQRVCWALGDIKDSTAVKPLIAVCNHTNWQVRDQAIGALGKIGDNQADDAVMVAMTDSIGQVRKAASVSAGKLIIQEAAAELVSLLGDPFYGARMTALNSLLQLDTQLVVEIVTDSIHSDNKRVGNLCCQLLSKFATDPAIELLLNETNSPEPLRRGQAGVGIIRADPLDNCDYRKKFVPQETDRLTLLKFESAISDAETTDRQTD